MKALGKIWTFFQERIIEHFSRYVFLSVIFLSFLEVVRRYIFGVTFLWYEDVEVYFNLVAVFLYFGLAQKQNAHIRLDIFLEFVKKKSKTLGEALEILSTLISLVFCCLFLWFGTDFVKKGMDFGRRTENADLLLWPFYGVLLLGFTFLGVEFARTLYQQVRKFGEGSR